MADHRKRLALALERLGPEDFQRFEEFASDFLAVEFRNLRTLASPSGDEGRDAFVWQPAENPTLALQYSVTTDWARKIRRTAARLKEARKRPTVLVYVTSQLIGARGDRVRHELLSDFSLYLDIRDRTWFLEQAAIDSTREVIGERLAEQVVDPYLADRGVTYRASDALGSSEARAACLYLALQWEDEARDKGLTRIAYESLVLAALRETDNSSRLARAEIHGRVSDALRGQRLEEVAPHVDRALGRLSRSRVRHWQTEDEFCLSHEERNNIVERLTDLEARDLRLKENLIEITQRVRSETRADVQTTEERVVEATRYLIDQFLYERGEAFAMAAHLGHWESLQLSTLRDSAVRMAAEDGSFDDLKAPDIAVVVESARVALSAPSDELHHHLRTLADTYTLFAFMRETADVQQALVKMFATGEIWLDTNVLLRVVAETLVDENARTYTNILRAAREAGLTLHMTEGVVEEIEGHMYLSLTYARNDDRRNPWRSHVPFLFSAFAFTGRARGAFPSWLEQFRGNARPLDDIIEVMREEFGVQVGSLDADAGRAPVELRAAVFEYWQEVHARRHRSPATHLPRDRIGQLASHDTENYLGVVWRRRGHRDSPFGHTTWWLTLDSAAFALGREALWKSGSNVPFHPPTISPDFMVSYLVIGPMRRHVSRASEGRLPLLVEVGALDFLPTRLLQIAERVRSELDGLPEHVIRRRVRDALDAARLRMGPMAQRGSFDDFLEDLKPALSPTRGNE